MPNTKKVYSSKEAYANLSPEKKAKRLAQMKAYYLKNKDKVLARHGLRNAKEKRFPCKVCGNKYYTSNHNFKLHLETKKHKRNERLKAEQLKVEQLKAGDNQQNPEDGGAIEPPRENQGIKILV